MLIFTLLVSLAAAVTSLYYWLRSKGEEGGKSYRTMTLLFGAAALVCVLLLVHGDFWTTHMENGRALCCVVGLACAVWLTVFLIRRRRKAGVRLFASAMTFAVLLMVLCGTELVRLSLPSDDTAAQAYQDRAEAARNFAEALLASEQGISSRQITTSAYGFSTQDGKNGEPHYYQVAFAWNENGDEKIYGYHVSPAENGGWHILAEGESVGRESIGNALEDSGAENGAN